MADFYADMAQAASELLAPTSAGGLGQGSITLTRTTPGTPDPQKPYEPPEPTKQTETLDGAAFGVTSDMIGTQAGSAVILATDRYAICTVPSIGYEAGDTLSIDGKTVNIISVENIPAAGVTCAVKFIIRG